MTAGEPLPRRQVALIDLLDRLLSGGAVVTGDITLAIADIDLVRISLRALIASIGPRVPAPWEGAGPLAALEPPGPADPRTHPGDVPESPGAPGPPEHPAAAGRRHDR
ncbi:gas vesicle protein [Streptomyces sp. LP05-1]|uniref:Gas vesicle protein n=1 Tax=Streptomyces pyxinae TaxID=2970734 RepID=A0ABT2CM71_9ACTN|nr:gas vesicle protein [Streptomyces sp. LP05-1]MCS0638530.1 gas vesicle protein [Streptomyces sp. LP05-1]